MLSSHKEQMGNSKRSKLFHFRVQVAVHITECYFISKWSWTHTHPLMLGRTLLRDRIQQRRSPPVSPGPVSPSFHPRCPEIPLPHPPSTLLACPWHSTFTSAPQAARLLLQHQWDGTGLPASTACSLGGANMPHASSRLWACLSDHWFQWQSFTAKSYLGHGMMEHAPRPRWLAVVF